MLITLEIIRKELISDIDLVQNRHLRKFIRSENGERFFSNTNSLNCSHVQVVTPATSFGVFFRYGEISFECLLLLIYVRL